MGTQIRMPGTLPTPERARAALVDARRRLRLALSDVEMFGGSVKDAGAVMEERERELDAAAEDFERSEADTPAERDAHRRHLAAIRAVREMRAALDAAQGSLLQARKTVKLARRELEKAEDDLLAIEEGRRSE